MINAFYIRIQDFGQDAPAIERLMEILPSAVHAKLEKISNRSNRYRSAMGEIVSRYAIQKVAGIKSGDLAVEYGSNGKPYLRNYPGIHYNISHSGEYVVCAVAKVNLGIDVEHVRNYNLRVAERYFSKPELADLLKFEGDQRRDYFFTLWTIKESYLKALGRGLTKSLSSFTVNRKGDGFSLSGEDTAADYSVFNTILPDNYRMSVCYMGQVQEIVLQELSLSGIADLFSGVEN
jgi:4'-phosphopantetheinyl transferase